MLFSVLRMQGVVQGVLGRSLLAICQCVLFFVVVLSGSVAVAQPMVSPQLLTPSYQLLTPSQLPVLLEPLPLVSLLGAAPLVSAEAVPVRPSLSGSTPSGFSVTADALRRPLSNVAALSAQEIEARILAKRGLDAVSAKGRVDYDAEAVAEFYEQRRYQLVWIESGLRQQLLNAIGSLVQDGLDPEDYFLARLTAMHQASLMTPDDEVTALVDRDILATEAYLRALYHLFNGKVDSENFRPQWSFTLQELAPTEVLVDITTAVDTGQVEHLFAQVRPQHPIYQSLQAALVRYRSLVHQGGWPELPEGPSLRPGVVDPQIAILRERLRISGEYVPPPAGAVVSVTPQGSAASMPSSASTTSVPSAHQVATTQAATSSTPAVDPYEVYDDVLVAAVKRFQRDQYLEDDGVVGAASRSILNVSAQARLDQIRVNLDRARWLLHNTPDNLLLVDVAGFKVTYIKERKPVWKSRVQVGMAYRTSPIFKSEINYITLNPTWTVPPTILQNDILPKLRTDLSYLYKNNIRVLDKGGNMLDPATIDWWNPGNVTLRQDASPTAALGRAVIRFPNSHAVYLHDTPHQRLFNKSQRAFSSGCIRVERVMELVELLLSETQGWDAAAIAKTLKQGKTRNVTLSRRIPIFLAYWTVDAISEEQVAFKPDIYARDKQVLAALDKPHARVLQ